MSLLVTGPRLAVCPLGFLVRREDQAERETGFDFSKMESVWLSPGYIKVRPAIGFIRTRGPALALSTYPSTSCLLQASAVASREQG